MSTKRDIYILSLISLMGLVLLLTQASAVGICNPYLPGGQACNPTSTTTIINGGSSGSSSNSTFNATYATWLPNYTQFNKFWYNMTLASSGNPFNQILNTTSNVTFASINLSTNKTTQIGNTNNGLINLQWLTNTSKPIIAWLNETGKEKIWLAGHEYLQNGNLHKHFSIETSNSSGQLNSKLEFPFDCDNNADCAIETHDADFIVGGTGNFEVTGGTSLFNNNVEVKEGNLLLNSTGTVSNRISRGSGSNFANFIFANKSIDQWTIGLRNDGTNNLFIRDSVNGRNLQIFNQSGIVTFPRNVTIEGTSLKVNGKEVCLNDSTNCPASGGNASWNQSFANTLYSGIQWGYNQTINLFTNGGDNGDRFNLNLQQGTGITLTDDGFGTVTIDSTGGTPSGNDNSIQYNNDGSFGGSGNFTYNYTSGEFHMYNKYGVTLGDVTGGTVEEFCGGPGPYDDNNFDVLGWNIYAFKDVGGTVYYSQNPSSIAFEEQGACGGNYYLNLTWNAVSGADGYRIEITQDNYRSYYSDYYLDIANPYMIYGNGTELSAINENPVTVTPKPFTLGVAFDINSSGVYFNGILMNATHQFQELPGVGLNATATLKIGGDASQRNTPSAIGSRPIRLDSRETIAMRDFYIAPDGGQDYITYFLQKSYNTSLGYGIVQGWYCNLANGPGNCNIVEGYEGDFFGSNFRHRLYFAGGTNRNLYNPANALLNNAWYMSNLDGSAMFANRGFRIFNTSSMNATNGNFTLNLQVLGNITTNSSVMFGNNSLPEFNSSLAGRVSRNKTDNCLYYANYTAWSRMVC